MNIFFGKISQNFDPVQLQEGYYTSDKGSSWFGELNLEDYVYMIGGGKIQLWKAKQWIDKKGEQEERLKFEIIFNDTHLKVKDLVAFKYFKLSMNLAVKSTRSTASEKKAFFKLEYDVDLTEEKILDKATYTIPENFRSIRSFLPDQPTEQDSYNIQIRFENGKLKLLPIKNCDPEIIDRFKDNIPFIGRGRSNKDKTLLIAKDLKNIGSDLDFSINNFFDAFLCDYNAKIEEILDKEQDIEPEISNNFTEKSKKMVLNQILYGPPGTGKTFNSINEALKIVDPIFYQTNQYDRKKLTERFKELLIKDSDENKGQIAFCTFHQSFSYEDFVEGIKPKTTEEKTVYYDVEPGVFKRICQLADSNNSTIKVIKEGKISWSEEEFKKASFYKLSLGNYQNPMDRPIYEYCRDNNYIAIGFGQENDFTGLSESEVKEKCDQLKLEVTAAQQMNYFIHYLKKNNYIIVSSGNKYIRALGKVIGDYEYFPDSPIHYNHFRKVEWLFVDENIPIDEIYERGLSQKTMYKIDDSALRQDFFTDKGQQHVIENKIEKKYVLIIDEINRGNVSSIFGELITLIEEEKRAGKEEELEVILPYSKEVFKVPSNIYIIGTMNTADRSVEALDAALRRRFCFEEMPPLYNLEELQNDIFGYKASEILKTINLRIEKLLDKDHKIGHSYLLNKDENSIIDSFYKNIIPLLQEYFFGDYNKIGLILGKGFVSLKELDNGSDIFADFDDVVDDFDNRNVYEIIDYRKGEDYKLTLNKVEVIMDFEKAIQVLMNK